MKTKQLFFVLLLLLLFQQAYTQTFNTQKGYAVTQQHDTLYGLIRERADLNERLIFKADVQGDFTEYTPDQIKSFAFTGGYVYRSVQVKTSESQAQHRFMLVLVEGTLNLYQARDSFYVQKLDNELMKLEKKDVMVDNNYKKIDKRYIGLLKYLMADCKPIQQKIDRTNYEANSLIKIVEAYNGCINPAGQSVVNQTPAKTKVHPGIRFGKVVSDMNYFVDGGRYHGEDFTTKSGYTGGVFFNISYKNKWSVQPELLLTQKGATLRRSRGSSTEYVNFSLSYLQVPVSLYYTLPTKRIRPFVSAGGVFGYALSKEAYYQYTTLQLPIKLNKDEYGYRGGGGVSCNLAKKYSIGVEYVYERSLTNRKNVLEKIYQHTHNLTVRMSL